MRGSALYAREGSWGIVGVVASEFAVKSGRDGVGFVHVRLVGLPAVELEVADGACALHCSVVLAGRLFVWGRWTSAVEGYLVVLRVAPSACRWVVSHAPVEDAEELRFTNAGSGELDLFKARECSVRNRANVGAGCVGHAYELVTVATCIDLIVVHNVAPVARDCVRNSSADVGFQVGCSAAGSAVAGGDVCLLVEGGAAVGENEMEERCHLQGEPVPHEASSGSAAS